MDAIICDLDKNQKILLFWFVLGFLALIIVFQLFYVMANKEIVYTNNDLNFYIQEDNYIVSSKDFAGIYKYSSQTKLLELESPILGVPSRSIRLDTENKTILDKKYFPLKRFNFKLSLDSLFKIDLFLSDIESIGETVKAIKTYNNVMWFSEMILGEQRKCARIVDDKGKPLFEVVFSENGKVESVVIENNPENIREITSFFDIKKAESLPFIETPLGNSVFFAANGTVSAIKNKANGDIAKFEIRLYGSSGLLFIENFLTDAESNKQ